MGDELCVQLTFIEHRVRRCSQALLTAQGDHNKVIPRPSSTVAPEEGLKPSFRDGFMHWRLHPEIAR